MINTFKVVIVQGVIFYYGCERKFQCLTQGGLGLQNPIRLLRKSGGIIPTYMLVCSYVLRWRYKGCAVWYILCFFGQAVIAVPHS